METQSGSLVWKIPRTEEPGWLQSTGLQRVRHDWVTAHTKGAQTQVGFAQSTQVGAGIGSPACWLQVSAVST